MSEYYHKPYTYFIKEPMVCMVAYFSDNNLEKVVGTLPLSDSQENRFYLLTNYVLMRFWK
jgi:hypothetical protein